MLARVFACTSGELGPVWIPFQKEIGSKVMYAVIEASGKQFRVAPGDLVRLDTLSGEPGTEVDLGKVLMVSGDAGIRTGADAAGVKVTGTITKHGRGVKIIVFKFKRKKQYKRTQGHRQNFTEVKVNAIA